MAALDFSDLIPTQPQQPAPAAAVQAPPPVSPQVVGQSAVFTDTGQSGTPGQVATYGTLARTGGYDPSQAPGSIRNPFGLRPGASIPAGAWYVDQNGGVQQAGQGGVSVPAAAPSSQPSMSAGAPSGAPSTGQALNFDDLVPKTDPLHDAANSIPAGLEHAATGVLGFVGNIGDLTDAGVQGAANGVRGLFGAPPIHLQHANPPGFNYPDSAELNRDIESVTGPIYQPQTWAGRAVDTGLSFAPAAVFGPEGAGAKILSTAVPAATSFGAGETARAFGHPEWAGPAQLVGGLTGGLGVAAAGAAPLSTRVLANATQGLSESDIAAAQALQTRAAAMGVPLTLPEAVAQTGSKGAPLLLAQRAVESSQGGGRVMAPFLAARPQAMRAAVGPVLDQIAPATDKPSAIGVQAQGVAQSALDRTRQAVNAPASPMYAAAQSDLIAPSDYAGLAANPSYQIALKAVRSNPELAPAIAGQPDNSAGVVNEVVKELDRSANAARITEMNPSGNNQLAAVRNQAAALANRVAGASSANYAGARSTVAQGMEGQYTPLQAGPTGAIAGTDQLGAQTRALYPARPYEGSAAETMAAVKAMNAAQAATPGASAADPLVTAMLTRQHLANAASEAMQTAGFTKSRTAVSLIPGHGFH